MRIFFWVGNIGNKYGSFEKYILLLARLCNEQKHELFVIHEFDNTVENYRKGLLDAGAKYLLVENTMVNNVRAISNAIRLVRMFKPHIFYSKFSNPLISIAAKIGGAPIVYKACGTGLGYKTTIRTRITRYALNLFVDRYLVVSKRVRNEEIGMGAQQKKVFISYVGLPTELLDQEYDGQFPKPLGFEERHLRKIITVGRFSYEKGMKFVTELAIDIISNSENVIWWLVGGKGPDLVYCQQLVEKVGLDNKIIFTGERNDVPALFSKSYLQVTGSLFEGLPLGILEASFRFVPTIAPDIPGVDEAIRNYETGLLVKPRSKNDFKAAVNMMLQTPDLQKSMGQSGHEFVLSNFNSRIHLEKLLTMMLEDHSHLYRKRKLC